MGYLGGPDIFQIGSSGDSVRDIQAALAFAGYLHTAPDGIYGPQTKQAVAQFQSDKGLAVDGIVGPNTWAALLGGGQPSAPPLPQPTPRIPSPTSMSIPSQPPPSFFSGMSTTTLAIGGLGAMVLATVVLGKKKRR